MDRRGFLTLSGATVGGMAALAAPAVAQSAPSVEWRCASGFPQSLPIPYGAAVQLAESVAMATEGRFRIVVKEEGGAMPSSQALEALRSGSLDVLHTAPHYFAENDPAFAFGSGLPFGLNQRLTDAWFHEKGGLELFNEFLGGLNLVGLPAGNTGAQTGGWFNREINSLDDLSGLRFRIGGFGARMLQRMGAMPVDVGPGAIAAALESGELDGAEFAGPADDLRLGLHRVARYLYYPGWWEGGVALMALVNRESFDALPESYRAILLQAASDTNMRVMARYDVANAAALQELIGTGTIVRPYTNDILEAAFDAAENVYSDIAAENDAFATMLASYMDFRRYGYAWFRRSEYAFSTFLIMLERSGRL